MDELQAYDEFYSLQSLFRAFNKKVLSVEAKTLRKISQEAQEFEKLLNDLQERFYKNGELIVTNFLIADFNEDAGYEIEEFLFATQKNTDIVEEYLELPEVIVNAVLWKELESKSKCLHHFKCLLESSLMVNKELYFMKCKLKTFFDKSLEKVKKVKELTNEFEELESYLKRTEQKLTQSIEALDNGDILIKHIKAQIFDTIHEVCQFLNKTKHNLNDLEKYYAEKKQLYGQKAVFLDQNFLNFVKKGFEIHKNFSCHFNPCTKLTIQSTKDVRKKKKDLLNETKENSILCDITVIDTWKIESEMDKYAKSVQKEYSETRYSTLRNLYKALGVLGTKYIDKNMMNGWSYQNVEKCVLFKKIDQFIQKIINGDLQEDSFWRQIRDFLIVRKDIDWSLDFLRSAEKLEKIEIYNIEKYEVVSQAWIADKNLKIRFEIFEILYSDFFSQPGKAQKKFGESQELTDFVFNKIRMNDYVGEFFKANSKVFTAIWKLLKEPKS